MTTVETALGPVATAELGPTLMHEHIVTRSPGVHENWPHLFERDAVLALAERKMADLYSRGIRAVRPRRHPGHRQGPRQGSHHELDHRGRGRGPGDRDRAPSLRAGPEGD